MEMVEITSEEDPSCLFVNRGHIGVGGNSGNGGKPLRFNFIVGMVIYTN